MLKQIIFISFLLLVFPRSAEAYLDPGTGSYITQLVVGLVLGASYLIKVYWSKIKVTVKSFFKKTTKNVTKDNIGE